MRHPTLIMDAKDYEALRSGDKRILIERTIRPGLHEDVTVTPLIRGEPLEIADAFKRPLGRFKAIDVKGAGFKDLETFKEYWQDKYGVEWNPQETGHYFHNQIAKLIFLGRVSSCRKLTTVKHLMEM